MRTLTNAIRQSIFAAQTGEAFLVLLELDHASLAAPIRVTSDAVPTVRGADTFLPFPFEVTIPDEPEGTPPSAELKIDNVDRSILEAIEGLDGNALDVTIVVVPASAPNTTAAGPIVLSLVNIRANALTVEGSLAFEPVLFQSFPATLFGPSLFPGLF
jgi:hypothetical protein